MTTTSTLKLAVTSEDWYATNPDVATMTVKVTDPNGASVKVQFRWAHDDESIRCIGDACTLVGVYSGSHLCALVGSFLWDKFHGDCECLPDVFLNAERDDFIELDMPIETPNYVGQ